MAANLASTKSNYISNVSAAAQALSVALATIVRLTQEGIDLGFQNGGANAIVDADCVGTNAYMTAPILNTGLTAVAGIDTTLKATSRAGYIALAALVPNPQ